MLAPPDASARWRSRSAGATPRRSARARCSLRCSTAKSPIRGLSRSSASLLRSASRFGLRSDLRQSGEEGVALNLQVVALAIDSGGAIVATLAELVEALRGAQAP
jgi:hypothetical protein